MCCADKDFSRPWVTCNTRTSGLQLHGRPSVLVDAADEDTDLQRLDRTRGRVFTYDSNGNLLFVFGGRGEQYGTTKNPVALAQLGDKMLILTATNCISVFEPTDYARAIWRYRRINAGLA